MSNSHCCWCSPGSQKDAWPFWIIAWDQYVELEWISELGQNPTFLLLETHYSPFIAVAMWAEGHTLAMFSAPWEPVHFPCSCITERRSVFLKPDGQSDLFRVNQQVFMSWLPDSESWMRDSGEQAKRRTDVKGKGCWAVRGDDEFIFPSSNNWASSEDEHKTCWWCCCCLPSI